MSSKKCGQKSASSQRMLLGLPSSMKGTLGARVEVVQMSLRGGWRAAWSCLGAGGLRLDSRELTGRVWCLSCQGAHVIRSEPEPRSASHWHSQTLTGGHLRGFLW